MGTLPRRFYRLVYIVVMGLGLLWIIDSQSIWLNPTQVLDDSSKVRGASFDRQESDRVVEMNRRIKVVAATTMGVVVGVEVLAFVLRRLRIFP
jgi:hypothetical protein